MTDTSDLAFLAEIIKAHAGQIVNGGLEASFDLRVSGLARREGHGGALELLRAARASNDPAQLSAIIEAMLPRETRFFRDRALWKMLRSEILPDMLKRHACRTEPLRIWSAGCATGQEAYSFAMAMAAHSPAGAQRSYEIVGTDISARAIERARSGLYTQFETQMGLPIRMLLQHFTREEASWQIDDSMRRCVRFVRHNVLGDMEPLGRFDLISCQGLFSTFDPERRGGVLQRMIARLQPDGVLIAGAGEEAYVRSLGAGVRTILSPWAFQAQSRQSQVA